MKKWLPVFYAVALLVMLGILGQIIAMKNQIKGVHQREETMIQEIRGLHQTLKDIREQAGLIR